MQKAQLSGPTSPSTETTHTSEHALPQYLNTVTLTMAVTEEQRKQRQSAAAAKRAMYAEGRLGRVLRGPACDYLPCGRRMCEVFLGRETGETPF